MFSIINNACRLNYLSVILLLSLQLINMRRNFLNYNKILKMCFVKNRCIVNFLDIRFLHLEKFPERTKNEIFKVPFMYNFRSFNTPHKTLKTFQLHIILPNLCMNLLLKRTYISRLKIYNTLRSNLFYNQSKFTV